MFGDYTVDALHVFNMRTLFIIAKSWTRITGKLRKLGKAPNSGCQKIVLLQWLVEEVIVKEQRTDTQYCAGEQQTIQFSAQHETQSLFCRARRNIVPFRITSLHQLAVTARSVGHIYGSVS